MIPDAMAQPLERWAEFSEDRVYRRKLYIPFDTKGPLTMFLMLNPSVADETRSDPTVTRCEGFARKWGSRGLYIGNLFDLVSTNPSVLLTHSEPWTVRNNFALLEMAEETLASGGRIICAWGTWGSTRHRDDDVRRNLRWFNLWCLRKTKDGCPAHPLYLPKSLEPIIYSHRRVA